MKKSKSQISDEVADFEAALLRSLDQALKLNGRFSKPDEIIGQEVGLPPTPLPTVQEVPATNSPHEGESQTAGNGVNHAEDVNPA